MAAEAEEDLIALLAGMDRSAEGWRAASSGVPVRRFRLWTRMRRAIAMSVAGATITHAALEAGFSSPAHFAAAFRKMFGMAPTQLLGGAPIFVEGDDRRSRVLDPPRSPAHIRS
jgi:AraC-like DNA-binding protein